MFSTPRVIRLSRCSMIVPPEMPTPRTGGSRRQRTCDVMLGASLAGAPDGGFSALALGALALQLAEAADRLGLFTGLLLRRLLEVPAQLHLTENTLALHLLLERAQGLVHVIVAYDDLHGLTALLSLPVQSGVQASTRGRTSPPWIEARAYSTGA